MANYYSFNNTYNQIELYFDYNSFKELNEEQKKELRTKFRWDGGFKCWYREYDKDDFDNCIDFARSLGLADGGWTQNQACPVEKKLSAGDTLEVRRECHDKTKETMTVVAVDGYSLTLKDSDGCHYQRKLWSIDKAWNRRWSIENFTKIEK